MKHTKKANVTQERMIMYAQAIKGYRTALARGTDFHISISNGNSKTGPVASVSIMPGVTCPADCQKTCGIDCYAAKIANARPSVLKAWARNTAILQERPEQYWQEVNLAIMAVRYFRFHVGGEIIGKAYFSGIIAAAKNNPHTEILVFTKRFAIVNAYIAEHGSLPGNLHILFSGWENAAPVNPYHLPETAVYEKHAEPDPNWKLCGGNCFDCACRGVGCWQAKAGDVIAFEKH